MQRTVFRVTPIARNRDTRVGVVDIGSNSIRLVVYQALSRAPMPVFNEKVLCGLGRDLARTGRLHRDGRAMALANLIRFKGLLEGMGVDHVDVLATAAVRDAADGPDFVAEVERRCDFGVTVIDGAEEARLSAMGVLSGVPDADGVMGDLGGGSLELVGFSRGRIGEHRVSLPLGPFRLLDGPRGESGTRETIRRHLAEQRWLGGYRGRNFYPVGGAWRSLAKVEMTKRKYPLHVIQQYTVPAGEITQLAGLIGRQGRSSLERLPGVNKRRLETLPAAGLVLEAVLDIVQPKQVVFSAFGLREGHLLDLLSPEERALDPLIEACRDIALRLDRFAHADLIFGWSAPLFAGEEPRQARLREAASLLSDVCWAEHPDYRAAHAFLRTLRLPIAGIDHAGRVFLALALFIRYGGSLSELNDDPVLELLPEQDKARAILIGLTLRLAQTLTGGASDLLKRTALEVGGGEVRVVLAGDAAVLAGDVVQRRLDAVAKAVGATGRITVSERRERAAG